MGGIAVMYQRDYILRLIEQMASGLSVIMGLRREQKPEQAIAAVDELLNRLFRLNSRLANTLSEKDLIAMFTFNGEPETEKLVMLATLIREEADIFGEMEEPDPAYSRYLRSLRLLLAVREHGGEMTTEMLEQIDASLEGLRTYRLPVDTQARLFGFWEQAVRYDRAEDALFELLEMSPEDGQAIEIGMAFYKRLLELPAEKLEAGGLPHDEVLAGLSEVERMKKEDLK
jgi:hypothetical protein